jgi:hypothetical protein
VSAPLLNLPWVDALTYAAGFFAAGFLAGQWFQRRITRRERTSMEALERSTMMLQSVRDRVAARVAELENGFQGGPCPACKWTNPRGTKRCVKCGRRTMAAPFAGLELSALGKIGAGLSPDANSLPREGKPDHEDRRPKDDFSDLGHLGVRSEQVDEQADDSSDERHDGDHDHGESVDRSSAPGTRDKSR